MSLRFTPQLETLGERANPSAVATEMTRQTSVVVDLSPEPGDECLVFFLGGVPAADGSETLPKSWVFGTELPDTAGPVRHRLFAIVDRTQLADPDAGEPGVTVVLQRLANPHLPAGTPGPDDAELCRRNQVTLLSMDQDRPGAVAGTHVLYQDIFIPPASVDPSDPSAAGDGRKYKMLVAPLILELDGAAVDPDDLVGRDVSGSAIGTANGGVWKTTDGGSSW